MKQTHYCVADSQTTSVTFCLFILFTSLLMNSYIQSGVRGVFNASSEQDTTKKRNSLHVNEIVNHLLWADVP